LYRYAMPTIGVLPINVDRESKMENLELFIIY